MCVCVGEIIVPLKENVSKWWSTDKLLKTAFDGIGGLPMSRIQDYREKHRVRAHTHTHT